jgi:acyl carrier protein
MPEPATSLAFPEPTPAKILSLEDQEQALRETLKRCSPATIEATLAYHRDSNPAHLPTIVSGIVERYVEPDLRGKLATGDDDLRFVEDLGIDSLTMMEIVLLVEDVARVQIPNDDLRGLRTLGDVKVYIDCKARGVPPPKAGKFLPVEGIAAVMPIQPPFLFLNEAVVGESGATGKYRITGQEFFLQGHFKDNPVMPASIMLEALGQLGVLYLIEGHVPPEPGQIVAPSGIYFTGCDGVRAHRVCKPGDLLSLSIKRKRMKQPLITLEGSIRVGQEKAIVAEEITLAFGYVAAPAPVSPPVGEPAAVVTPIATAIGASTELSAGSKA